MNQQDAALAVLCLLTTAGMLYMFWTRLEHVEHTCSC